MSSLASTPAPAVALDLRPVNLLEGWPSPDLLPVEQIRRAADRTLSDRSLAIGALEYAPYAGYQPLREELACWLGRFYHTAPDPSRICISGGASQGLASILQSFTDPAYTRAVWMVAPCYFLACNIFADAGFAGRLRAFPEDDEGIDVAYLETELEKFERAEDGVPDRTPYKHPRNRKLYRHVIYLVSTCANPSGRSLSLQRREALVRLARKFDALLISDDVYDFLQWSTASDWPPPSPVRPREMRLPRLSDIDRSLGVADSDPSSFGHAVSNGSFSKLIGPGVRTGWIDASPAFAFGLSQSGASKSGGAPSGLTASIIHNMLQSGEIERHIETVTRPGLQKRHRLILEAIRQYLEPHGISHRAIGPAETAKYGGYFVWLDLPSHLHAKALADRTRIAQNLIIGNGDLFNVQGDEKFFHFENKLRLCFACEPEEDIVGGVRRLSLVIESMKAEPSALSGGMGKP